MGEDELSAAVVKKECVYLPEAVFLLGGDIDYVAKHFRDLDRSKHLGLGNILDSTPPHWVHLDGFYLAKRMVSNGEYMKFITSVFPGEGKDIRVYDDSEIWQYIWQETGHKITEVKTPVVSPEGRMGEYTESYGGCSSFVTAYISSLRYELTRVLAASTESGAGNWMQGGTTRIPNLPCGEELGRAFALIKYKLRFAIMGEEDDDSALLTGAERKHLAGYKDGQEGALEDIRKIEKEAGKVYGRQIDKRFKRAFKEGRHSVETLLFLRRFAKALEATDLADITDAIPLHQVLFPRGWISAERRAKKAGKGRFIKKKKSVDWEELPVTGITLYEALAYCIWLTQMCELDVSLPNEGQYERAAGWGVEQKPNEKGVIELDPSQKSIFPWESHSQWDFNHYFGDEAHGLESFYQKDTARYSQLLEETSRDVREGERIEQLLGFGWHWTCERFDELERKYQRFGGEYQKYTDVKCAEADGKANKPVQVYDYDPNFNPNLPYFVMRGAPEIIGGPGLVTRRFAAYPFRGYSNVGFRYVVRE